MRFDKPGKTFKGGTLKTPLFLLKEAVGDMDAVTKKQVDDNFVLYILRSGDVATGDLLLARDPVNNNEATNKRYVDNLTSNAVPYLTGNLTNKLKTSTDTMTGPLNLSRNPVSDTEVATKQYLDNLNTTTRNDLSNALNTKVNVAGDTMSGFLTIGYTINNANQIVHKQYVDDVAAPLIDLTSANNSLNTKVRNSELGVPNGVATLDSSGKVPADQLPLQVDNVVEVNTYTDLPVSGQSATLYVVADENEIYRWSGSNYVKVSSGILSISQAEKLIPGGVIKVGNTSRLLDGTSYLSWSVDEVGGVSRSKRDAPNGVAGLDPTGKIHPDRLDTWDISIKGPTNVYSSTSNQYTITAYSDFNTYSVSVDKGSVSLSGSTITFNAPSTEGIVNLTVTKNGKSKTFGIQVGSGVVSKPSIISPTNNEEVIYRILTIEGSSFQYVGGAQTHVASQWQLATDSGFINIVADTGETTTYKTSWITPELQDNVNYYVRVRYKGNVTGWSEWSNTVAFKTKLAKMTLSRVNSNWNGFTLSSENGQTYFYFSYDEVNDFGDTANSRKRVIVKTDKNYNVVWKNTLTNSVNYKLQSSSYFNKIYTIMEGTTPYVYIVLSAVKDINASLNEKTHVPLLVKLNGNTGQIVWSKNVFGIEPIHKTVFPFNSFYITDFTVLYIKNGQINIVVTLNVTSYGSTTAEQNIKTYVARVDKDGNFLSGLQTNESGNLTYTIRVFPIVRNLTIEYICYYYTRTAGSSPVYEGYAFHTNSTGSPSKKFYYTGAVNNVTQLKDVMFSDENDIPYIYLLIAKQVGSLSNNIEYYVVKLYAASLTVASTLRLNHTPVSGEYGFTGVVNFNNKTYIGFSNINEPVATRKNYFVASDFSENFLIETSINNNQYISGPSTVAGLTSNTDAFYILSTENYVETDSVLIQDTGLNVQLSGEVVDFGNKQVTINKIINSTEVQPVANNITIGTGGLLFIPRTYTPVNYSLISNITTGGVYTSDIHLVF